VKTFLRFFVAGAFLSGILPARAELVTAVAVVVNDSVVTLGEIKDQIEGAAPRLLNRFGNDKASLDREVARLRVDSVEQMVEDKLILHDFLVSGYVTNLLEAVIDDQILEIIRKDYHGDSALLTQTLHKQGITREMFRRRQRERFIINYMVYQNSSHPSKILISPLKIDQYYQSHTNDYKLEDQVKLRMIVLPKSSESAPGSATRLAGEILAKIDSGVPFAEMASVYSSGSQRAEGGDRGWVNRTYFKPELAEAAFSLKPGQHSGIIEQPEACYLMMVDEVKSAHVRPLAEVRGDIELKLRNDENLRLKKLWIERLKRKSFVSYY
jgi:parvulin-like peptidyl-prolyl isomerase